MLLSTAALVLAARLLVRPDRRLLVAAALGLTLGLAQLVRAWTLWTVGVVGVVLVVAAATRVSERRTLLAALAIVARARGGRSRPVVRTPAQPVRQRRLRAAAPGREDLVTAPARVLRRRRIARGRDGAVSPLVLVVSFCRSRTARRGGTISGCGAGCPTETPTAGVRRRARDDVDRRRAVHARRGRGLDRPPRPRAPPPRTRDGAAAGGAAARSQRWRASSTSRPSYPTPDGDTVKGSFMLTAVPAWAACFGFAFDGHPARGSRGSRCRSWRALACSLSSLLRSCSRARARERAAGAEEWGYLRVGFAVVLVLVVAELAGWLVYRSVHHGPTALALTEKCLRREKLLQIEPLAGRSRGAARRAEARLRRVSKATACMSRSRRSDAEAAKLVAAYLDTTGRNVEIRLERVEGIVVYLWEQAVRAHADAASDDVRLLVRVTVTERRAARLGVVGALVVVVAQLVVGVGVVAHARRPDAPRAHPPLPRAREGPRGRGRRADDRGRGVGRRRHAPDGRRGRARHDRVATSEAEVERLRAAYAAGDPGPRLDVHGRYVDLWLRAAVPDPATGDVRLCVLSSPRRWYALAVGGDPRRRGGAPRLERLALRLAPRLRRLRERPLRRRRLVRLPAAVGGRVRRLAHAAALVRPRRRSPPPRDVAGLGARPAARSAPRRGRRSRDLRARAPPRAAALARPEGAPPGGARARRLLAGARPGVGDVPPGDARGGARDRRCRGRRPRPAHAPGRSRRASSRAAFSGWRR